MTERMEAQIELCPGFPRPDPREARHEPGRGRGAQSELRRRRHQRRRPDLRQLYTRPAVRLDPYSTPADGLYLCSSATPPGGGVHGMCGLNAAVGAPEPAVTPQRRTALVSVVAALVLIGLKLGAGLASGSLGLVSEAIHSGTDLVAALLTFLALGVAGRPAAPATRTVTGRLSTLRPSPRRRSSSSPASSSPTRRSPTSPARTSGRSMQAWYTFLVIGIVIAVDASRALSRGGPRAATGARRSRRTRSTSAATSPGRSRC